MGQTRNQTYLMQAKHRMEADALRATPIASLEQERERRAFFSGNAPKAEHKQRGAAKWARQGNEGFREQVKPGWADGFGLNRELALTEKPQGPVKASTPTDPNYGRGRPVQSKEDRKRGEEFRDKAYPNRQRQPNF